MTNMIFSWSAKRSGDSITVEGKTIDGARIKVPHILRIDADCAGEGPVAINDSGDRFILISADQHDPQGALARLAKSRTYLPTA